MGVEGMGDEQGLDLAYGLDAERGEDTFASAGSALVLEEECESGVLGGDGTLGQISGLEAGECAERGKGEVGSTVKSIFVHWFSTVSKAPLVRARPGKIAMEAGKIVRCRVFGIAMEIEKGKNDARMKIYLSPISNYQKT
jgi:hypothetical protein